MSILQTFQQLGLKEDHTKVYLANLEWGETIMTNIARKSRIPRSTVYILMDDLLTAGLVTRSMHSGDTLYSAVDPEYLVTLLEQKQQDLDYSISQLKQSMSNLKAMQNANPNKPKVEFLEGSEGITQAYERSLNDNPERIDIQCFTSDYKDVVSDEFFEQYFKKFFSSRVKSRELINATEADEAYIKQFGKRDKLQLMVNTAGKKIETDFWVYDNKVSFVSFNSKSPYALIIEDADIANATRTMFDLAWKKAALDDPRVVRGEKVQVDFE